MTMCPAAYSISLVIHSVSDLVERVEKNSIYEMTEYDFSQLAGDAEALANWLKTKAVIYEMQKNKN